MLERLGLLPLSQADTERVVKTIRKVEPRFAGLNEVKESKIARPGSARKIFVREQSGYGKVAFGCAFRRVDSIASTEFEKEQRKAKKC